MSEENTGVQQGAPTENQEGQQPSTPQRPENVPEKFWNAETGSVNTEALLASYVELEKARSKPQDAPQGAPEGEGGQTPSDTEGQPPEPKQGATEAYNAAVAKASEELASEDGKISDETYKAFEATGVTREQVDTYVDGQIARAELRKVYAEREAGGEDVYAELLQWAGANYSAEEAESFNNTVFGPSRDAAMEAVRALKARYEASMGNDGKIVTNGTGTTAAGGYTNRDEWLADIRNPEYKRNEAFRNEVRKKLEGAMRNGVNMGLGVSMG